jgi:glycosyltransferase involved in cell wall biosynthesis
MNTIHITIPAYNAEKTLRRAIDSILAQTYKNYKIYVLENGSTDGTRAIIDEYAERHGIIPFYNEKNFVYNEKSRGFISLAAEIPLDDFWARLDADDELFPENFETLINFAIENDLDIAAGNYECLNTQTGEHAPRIPITGKDLFFTEKDDYSKDFLNNFPYFMPLWGKIFRGTVSGLIKDFLTPPPQYGRDSLTNIAAVKKANRVGCINKPLIKYYVATTSVSYQYRENRKFYPEKLFNALCELITEKAGEISSDNAKLIYNLYVNEVRETLRIYLWVNIKTEEKFEDLEYFFNHQLIRELYQVMDYFEVVKNKNKPFDLFDQPLEWIFENLQTLPPERVIRLYYLFFDVIYQSKPVKFTEEEIRFMLSVSVPLANSLLLGIFDNAEEVFARATESEIKQAITAKVERLK